MRRYYNSNRPKAVWDTEVPSEDLAALSVGASKLQSSGQEFAMKTVEAARKHGGKLTEKWAARVPLLLQQIAEVDTPKKIVRKDVGDLHTIFNMFKNNPLKKPVLKVAVPKASSLADSDKAEDFDTFHLSIAGPESKYKGDINVIDYRRAKPWLGHILPTGIFEATRSPFVQDSERVLVGETLQRVAASPVIAAQLYGHIMGKCCFCNQSVGHGDVQRSAVLGYGPVCAKNWGMPYSAAAEKTAKKAIEDLVVKQGKPARRKVNPRRKSTA